MNSFAKTLHELSQSVRLDERCSPAQYAWGLIFNHHYAIDDALGLEQIHILPKGKPKGALISCGVTKIFEAVPSHHNWADLATERQRHLTTARANQTTGLTNGRATNWAPEVEFSPFRALSRRQLTFPSCC